MKLKLGFAPPIHHVVSIQKFIAWYDSVLNAVWDGFKMADKQQARIAGFHPSNLFTWHPMQRRKKYKS